MYATVIFWLLVWLTPVLAFTANNAPWFTLTQCCGSLVLSVVLGALCGSGAVFLPPVASAALGGLVFCLLSERLLDLFLPGLGAKALAVLGCVAFFAVLGHFFGLWPLSALLAVYLCFSALDLNRNRKKPKHLVPLAHRPGEKAVPLVDEDNTPLPQMPAKPNIYILFLESIHSRAALELLYAMDDGGLEAFLSANGFSLFSQTCSNEYGTTLSLNTLLNMSSEGSAPLTDAPPAFRWLKASGYELNLIDCAIYTFAHYIPWCDYFNFSIPRWVEALYARFLPFFLQSALLTALTGGIDPFADKSDYRKAHADLLRRMERHGASPAFYLVRFGATHVPNHYTWKQRKEWQQRYRELYEKVVPQIREMVEEIVARDPGACIVAMGDHGAASWQYSWLGNADCNANMRRNGVEPAVVAQDLVGALLAVRLPGVTVPDQPMTPSAVLRLIFGHNGVPAAALPVPPSNCSYLHEPSNPRAFFIAQGCVPLHDWEIDTPAARLERRLKNGQELVIRSAGELLDVAGSLENSGNFAQSVALLEQGLPRFPASARLAVRLSQLYARLGLAAKSPALLQPFIDSDVDALCMFCRSMALMGHGQRALKLLDVSPLAQKMPARELRALRVQLCTVSGMLAEAARCCAEAMKLPGRDRSAIVADACGYATLLDALGRTREGVAELDSVCAEARDKPATAATAFLRAAGLGMRLLNFAGEKERIERFFAVSRPPYPVTLYLWQAGVYEQTGDIDAALKCLIEARDAREPVPFLQAQTGFFLMRHALNSASLRAERRAAEACLRDTGGLVRSVLAYDWYRETYGALLRRTNMDPVNHFIHYGRLLALDPNPWFNQVFYLLGNQDVFFAGYDPFLHFLTCSPYENRDPSLHFSLQAYMAKNSAVNWNEEKPFIHFLLQQQKRSAS